MSEAEANALIAGNGDLRGNGQLTAGGMLRRAREGAGLHIAALAVSLKVPVSKLEALEADRVDLLPDAVFARALAGGMCRALKVDPKPILEKLPASNVLPLTSDERGINAPFRSPSNLPGSIGPVWFSKPTFWIVAALLLGTLALIFMPNLERFASRIEPSPGALASAQTAEPMQVAQTPEKIVPVTAPAKSEVAVAPASSTAPLSDKLIAAAGNAGEIKEPMASTPEQLALVSIKAKNATWVALVDSRGNTQFSKILNANEVVTSAGPMPISVVVGRADAVDVVVRGKTFDLVPVTRENVARFEVR